LNDDKIVELIINRFESLEEQNREDHKEMKEMLQRLGDRVNILEQFRAKIYAIVGVIAFIVTIITNQVI